MLSCRGMSVRQQFVVLDITFNVMKETVDFPESRYILYQKTRHNIPEDSSLLSQCSEDIKILRLFSRFNPNVAKLSHGTTVQTVHIRQRKHTQFPKRCGLKTLG